MTDVINSVTMKGSPLALLGNQVAIGQSAPDANLVANDLSNFQLGKLKGSRVILSVVPSLDTPVCDIQTRRFNQEAAKLGVDTRVITISMDLPFAQKRWCAAADSTNILTLSDYRDAEFGKAYGVLVKELRLLARAVFIIDSKGIIRYKEIVNEITAEPDYAAALEALAQV